MSIVGWYYLHVSGYMVYKRDIGDGDTVVDIRESDFATGLWPVDPEDRAGAWRICVEGLAAGAGKERIMHLVEKWGCNEKDAPNYAQFLGVSLFMDGDQWCVTPPGFRNLQEDPAGFGPTPVEAFAELCKALGYWPSKMWGPTFKSLVENYKPAPVGAQKEKSK